MASTGEVAAFGKNYDEALIKSILSANSFNFNKKSVLLSLGGQVNKAKFLEAARAIGRLGYKIFATDTTAGFLQEQGVACEKVLKAHEAQKHSSHQNFIEIIEAKQVAFVINLSQTPSSLPIPSGEDRGEGKKSPSHLEQRMKVHLTDGFHIRRAAVDNQIPLFTDLHLARAFVRALENYGLDKLEIKSYKEYLGN
jgi:carbamoyl-phosphate synthase large subunit